MCVLLVQTHHGLWRVVGGLVVNWIRNNSKFWTGLGSKLTLVRALLFCPSSISTYILSSCSAWDIGPQSRAARFSSRSTSTALVGSSGRHSYAGQSGEPGRNGDDKGGIFAADSR